MSPQVQRGRRVFLILAGLVVVLKLIPVGMALANGFANVNWLRGVVLPVSLAMCVVCMWEGENWLIWLVSLPCVVAGGSQLFACIYLVVSLAWMTPFKASWLFLMFAQPTVLLLGVPGAINLTAGLLFLLSPSLKAFFQYQRASHTNFE